MSSSSALLMVGIKTAVVYGVTVLFEQNGDRFTFAHGTGDTPAS